MTIEPSCRSCRVCSTPTGQPHHRLCRDCRRNAVWSQDQVRREVPWIRHELNEMNISFWYPVQIRLVPPKHFAAGVQGTFGHVAGLTTSEGGKVTSLSVVAGLVRAEFGATVVHESMRAWMIQRHFAEAPAEVVEGICRLIAHAWLCRHRHDPCFALVFRRLSEDSDPVHGNGLRLVRESVRRHGMAVVLQTVRREGGCPQAAIIDPHKEGRLMIGRFTRRLA